MYICINCICVNKNPYVNKNPCIGKPSKKFISDWEGELINVESKLRDLVLYEYVEKLFKSEEAFNCLFEELLIQDDWLLKVRGHLEKYEKILRQRKLKKLKKLTKSNEFLFFECLGQFDSHEPFFSFKHQFFKFCNSFVPDFENLHNLVHLNDVSDTKTMFDDSSISDSENSKNCEGTPFSNVQGNEVEMCDGRLKGKFVSTNVINLSKRNLSENEISLLSKGLNFIPTCNKVDVARLKLELEQFGRMLRLKWHFRNDKRDIPINPFKAKSTFNPRNKDAAIEIYLSSLEEKL